MISISSAYTQRGGYWTTWKEFQAIKQFVWQSQTENDIYWIWGYDGPECFITQIWRGEVPVAVLGAGYTQEQNDADKADWEVNYLPTTNGKI